MYFDQLPDDCVRLIFGQCALQHYAELRLVCRRWFALISALCATKRSLKLFPTLARASEYCDAIVDYDLHDNASLRTNKVASAADDLLIATADRFHLVAQTFPNLHSLVICLADNNAIHNDHHDDSQHNDHYYLRNQWKSLKSLAIFYMPRDEKSQHQIWQWLDCDLSRLQHLNMLHMFELNVGILSAIRHKNGQKDNPFGDCVLWRLRHFAIGHCKQDIAPILGLLGPKCVSLSLDYVTIETDQRLCSIVPNLTFLRLHFVTFQQFSNLNSQNGNYSRRDRANYNATLSLICDRFSQLTHFDFSFSYFHHLVDLIPELARLKHLLELRLYMCTIPLLARSPDHMRRLVPLSTVKTLHLTHFAFSHPNDGAYLCLIPRVFPKLEVVTLAKHHDTPWPLLCQLCQISDLPFLRRHQEHTFECLKSNLQANLC